MTVHSKVRREENMAAKSVGMSVNIAAVRSGCSRTALYEANRRGELIFRKFGRKTLILEEDLIAFLRNLPRKETALSQSHQARVQQRWQKELVAKGNGE